MAFRHVSPDAGGAPQSPERAAPFSIPDLSKADLPFDGLPFQRPGKAWDQPQRLAHYVLGNTHAFILRSSGYRCMWSDAAPGLRRKADIPDRVWLGVVQALQGAETSGGKGSRLPRLRPGSERESRTLRESS